MVYNFHQFTHTIHKQLVSEGRHILYKNWQKWGSMYLTQKELSVLNDLKTQEQNCIEKYTKYAELAADEELKELFLALKQDEQKHFESLRQVLAGTVPSCDCNDTKGRDYAPKGTYKGKADSQQKQSDCFLATDSIGTEKLVSTEYNFDVFAADNTDIRKLLADIQIEEQNHAEMLYKYKKENQMV